MPRKAYQLKVTLIGSNPEIWRQIIVKQSMWLVDFHRVLQTALGWTNSHLHAFRQEEDIYQEGIILYAPSEFEVENSRNSRLFKLNKILNAKQPCIYYEYDFGDSWDYKIELEEILIETNNLPLPRCIGGWGNCPPEDVGGLTGFYDMLEILKKPRHPEYKSYITWLGGKYDPDRFDMLTVNHALQQKDYGCEWME